MFRALLGMPLIHKTLINIFLQKLPILQAQIVFYSVKTAKARGCINRAILEEKCFMMFFHHENPHEATNGFVKAVTLHIFSKFSNVKFSPHCVFGSVGTKISRFFFRSDCLYWVLTTKIDISRWLHLVDFWGYSHLPPIV